MVVQSRDGRAVLGRGGADRGPGGGSGTGSGGGPGAGRGAARGAGAIRDETGGRGGWRGLAGSGPPVPTCYAHVISASSFSGSGRDCTPPQHDPASRTPPPQDSSGLSVRNEPAFTKESSRLDAGNRPAMAQGEERTSPP
ncbi:hypothetical protein SLA_1450 [Streptomyces laurentii]|uniref:Uncharacterized protein n=1 Tax=Streptomyces laurentii TaxID=39478 RepID=A0A160NUX8_STRLU|nr:hypothetical protein SLA_1450 [Streptomyces laurentii]